MSTNEVTAQILKLYLDRMFNNVKDRNKYLINCLYKQGFIKKEEEYPIEENISIDVCRICNSNNLIYSTHAKICNDCGSTEESQTGNLYKNYKMDLNAIKSTFIKPGTNIITVSKNGKDVRRDLSQVQTWLTTDASEIALMNDIKFIEERIDRLEYRNTEEIKKLTISMFVNVLKVNEKIRGKEKLATMAWCVYYSFASNNINLNIQKLAPMFDVTTGVMNSYNFLIKEIFKNTSFEQYIPFQDINSCNIELDDIYKRELAKVIKKLEEYDYFTDPLTNKQLAGIIYTISTKILKDNKYKLKSLAEKCSVSETTISKESKKYINKL